MLGDWKSLTIYLWCESFSEMQNSLSILRDRISIVERREGREGGALDAFFSSSFFLLPILLSVQDDDERCRSERYE